MRRSVDCMLTLGRNYSSPVYSSPGPGRYLTPWRVPTVQRGRDRKSSTLFRERQWRKSSSSSIQGRYTADWLQSLWIKESRSVSTSGLRRDGLSSCCCCQRLVKKKDKAMKGRDTQDKHKHKEEVTHLRFKDRKARPLLCLLVNLRYTPWRSNLKILIIYWWEGKEGRSQTKELKK